MKRATSISLDIELIELLRKKKYNISGLANELLWMVAEGRIPEPQIRVPIRVNRRLITLEAMLKHYIDQWGGRVDKAIEKFVEDRLDSSRSNPMWIYGEPTSPFHDSEGFKKWCFKIAEEYIGEPITPELEVPPKSIQPCAKCGKLLPIEQLERVGNSWLCAECG